MELEAGEGLARFIFRGDRLVVFMLDSVELGDATSEKSKTS